MKHGRGTEKFAYGDFYVGEFANGRYFTSNPRFDGQGEYIWANGNSYLGEFKNGSQNGYGVWKKQQKKSDGEVHEGYFTNAKKDGIGITKFQNGNFYRGYYYKDKRQGYGEMNWIDKRCSYRGEWIENVQSGIGILEFESEVDPYFGTFQKGILMDLMNIKDKKSLLDKLAEMKRKMEEEIEKFKHESAKRGNISRILGETINSIYDKKLYDLGGKRGKPHGKNIPSIDRNPGTSRVYDKQGNNRNHPSNESKVGNNPNQMNQDESLNSDVHRSNNYPSNSRLQKQAGRSQNPETSYVGRGPPSGNSNYRGGGKLPGLKDRPDSEIGPSYNHSYRDDSYNPRRIRENINYRDKSFNNDRNGQFRSNDILSVNRNKGGSKPFQFYKGRTTYLDKLIKDKMNLQRQSTSNGKKRPVILKEARANKPIWKPSGISVQPNYNMGNILM